MSNNQIGSGGAMKLTDAQWAICLYGQGTGLLTPAPRLRHRWATRFEATDNFSSAPATKR